ncbi:thioesterase family protein [Actinoplanes sp. NPDC049596]|uniref:thioesterase family protein n=1 Tax=unclassified Actinoplanes TaxID=2626549 RepID=UPI0034459530
MSFYLPLGDGAYRPTKSTESPWDEAMQHGGPPAALLGRLMRVDGQRLARISVDFLGPIPRRDVRVEVSPLKPGRLTTLNEARMTVDGRTAVIARAWHIAPGPPPPVITETTAAGPLPDHSDVFFPEKPDWGYGRAIEWRATDRTSIWTRVKHELIDGEENTGQDRALIIADSANGVSAVLPLDKWLSIPPTMSTALLREPAGEWVHLSCRTALSNDGLGLCTGELYDAEGALGAVTQPLLVRAR